METKTLSVIQTLAKVGKVISKIIFVCCIIGAAGCLIGICAMTLFDFETIKIGGLTIHNIIEKNAEMSTGTMLVSMAMGMILCICECVLAKVANKYFKNELKAGTPFTMEGANELQRLGICTIAIPVGGLVIANITYNIMNKCLADVADMHLDSYNQVGMGIVLIIMALICKYGAERELACYRQ